MNGSIFLLYKWRKIELTVSYNVQNKFAYDANSIIKSNQNAMLELVVGSRGHAFPCLFMPSQSLDKFTCVSFIR